MLKIPLENKKYISEIKYFFEKKFKSNRIIFLGLHGSSRHNSLAPSFRSDIDLELILDKVLPEDLVLIKNLLDNIPVKIECQVRSYLEICNKDSLIYKTNYKIFMFFAYANGITLLGENIYKKLVKEIGDTDCRNSFLLSIHLAWKDLRKFFLSGKSDAELNKLIEVLLFDILLYKNVISYKDLDKKKIFESKRYNVFLLSAEYFSSVLSKDESKTMIEYQNLHNKNIFNISILIPLDKIFRFIELDTIDIK